MNLLLSLHSVLCLLHSVTVPWIILRSTIDFDLLNYIFFPLASHPWYLPTSLERLSMEEWVQLLWWDFGLHSMEDDSKTQHLRISQLSSNKRGRLRNSISEAHLYYKASAWQQEPFLWFQFELDQYGEWRREIIPHSNSLLSPAKINGPAFRLTVDPQHFH